MQMKTVWLLVLLVLFSLSLSHQGHAEEEEPRPADWSGDAGLSVSTDGDSGPCAITPSHGHGTKNPACTPLTISGTETPSNGSVYTVTGGVGPFTWSASGGTITPSGERTATINVDGTCGNGTITVDDSACQADTTKKVRFPSGQWVKIATLYRYEYFSCGTCSINNFCANCTQSHPWSGNYKSGTWTAISGKLKIEETGVLKWSEDFTGGALSPPLAAPMSAWPANKTVGPCSSYYEQYGCAGAVMTADVPVVEKRTIYEWQCP